jgi:hypothetical protein
MKKILKKVGIHSFIAIKRTYNASVDSNDFYKMLRRRLKYSKPDELAIFLRSELHIHFKEYAQYQ